MKELTFEDLRKMAKQESEEIHPDEAMRRLGPAFSKLRECKDGKDFMEEMERIFLGMEDGRIDREDVNVHTIIGVCQLVHHVRNGISPSRQKSFKRIIPWLIQLRNKIQKKTPEDIIKFVLQKFEERNRPALSNVRPESIKQSWLIPD